jgi:hypothetical protein
LSAIGDPAEESSPVDDPSLVEASVTFLLIILLIIAAVVVMNALEHQKVTAMPPAERERYLAAKRDQQVTLAYGPVNPAMICPHCGVRGNVRTKFVDRKKGVSGGKATAAVLTGGVSMLATGLSRKES